MAPTNAVIGRTDYGTVKTAIHRRLIQKLNLDRITEANRDEVRRQVGSIVESLVVGESTPMNLQERERLVQEVLDEVFGLGPLESLLADPTVSDILVNTSKHVYIERKGMLEETTIQFRDDAHLMTIIDRIVSAVGRRVDESSPMVDARLADGSRVNAIIPPLSIDGPCPFDPAIWSQTPVGPRADRKPDDDPIHAGVAAGLREGAVERRDFGWNRRRENYFSECLVVFHFQSRTRSDHRRRGRIAAESGTRGAA